MKRLRCKRFLFMSALLSIIIILSQAGCAKPDTILDHPAITPPVRFGEGSSSASFLGPFSFKDIYNFADAVAVVEIRDWVGEYTEEGVTFFKAKVNTVIKGSLEETIIVPQDGTSKNTYKGHPLFTAGNVLLVFFKGEAQETEFGLAYPTITTIVTICDVVKSDDGTQYVIDRVGMMGQFAAVRNYSSDSEITNELYRILAASDEITANINSFSYVYKLYDIINIEFAEGKLSGNEMP